MAVVWGTVKDLKGYIDVQSVVGDGTTFTLYFPVSREPVEHNKPEAAIEDLTGNGESILIVDDIVDQIEIGVKVLNNLGYAVDSVSSGEMAVDYMKENSVDLLLLDMLMDPGIDGLETYKKILEMHPGQKAIIVSGFSETERVKEAQRIRQRQRSSFMYATIRPSWERDGCPQFNPSHRLTLTGSPPPRFM